MDADEITLTGPKNAEHFEATQKAVNESRSKLVENLPLEVKDNFKLIEDFVAEVEKRDLPFVLFINPSGYVFEGQKEMSAKGFWRWQKLHGNAEPYSEECINNCRVSLENLADIYINFLTPFFKELRLVVFDPDSKPLKMYQNGRVFSLEPNKENE